MKKFPIGFWNYTTGQLSAKDVKDWADLGMTMANSPEIMEGADDAYKTVISGILDACAENDIKVIVFDRRALWRGASDDPDGYKARFLAAYEEYGGHHVVLRF